ncbi:MAG: flagellar motor protein MotB [Betaproteobacteria bacterium]|nr:flagellar motor protein MotB [Betaproteobacteria bacterium]
MATEGEEKPEGEAAPAESAAPVIVIKKVMDDGHGGAHGGAWKIALADMMTAMMAFFLLMWLLGASTDDQRKSIADYFKPTSQSLIAIGQLAGSNGILGGRSIIDPDGFPFSAKQTALLERLTPRSEGGPNPDTEPGPENENENADPDKLTPEQKKKIAAEADQANFDKLEKELMQKLSENKRLENLKEQVSITREKDGLRIEIIDKADFAMFPSGQVTMQGKAQALINEVAASLADMPNKIAIRGHTDAVPFQNPEGRNNWSLSADRAEATRKMLEKNGIKESRFAKIEGVADTDPFNPKDPRDPRNRRMSITVQYQDP